MKLTQIIPFLAIPILCSSCADNEPQPPAKYEEKKASLQQIEQDSPRKFLKIAGSRHGNLLNQTVVEGEITNRATLVSYKNVQIQITFLDKDGAEIDKEKETIEDIIKPGATNDFKIKSGHIKGADAVSFKVIDAVVER